MISRRFVYFVVVVATVALVGAAASSAAQEYDPEYFGPNTNFYYVGAEEFNCSDPTGDCSYHDCGGDMWCDTTGYAQIYAPVRLPSGALVTGYRVVYEDSSAAGDFAVRFDRAWYIITNNSAGYMEIDSWMSSGAPGVSSSWVDINPDYTIQYHTQNEFFSYYHNYYLWVTLYPTSDIKLRGVIVYWNRQISPAPASQTFPDVAPGFWAFQEIEALAASGITTGFPDGTYRPTEPVTRAQMATFLARALGLHWAP